MTRYWTFKDYVSASGKNEFHAWLDGQSKKVKAGVNVRVAYLEVTQLLERPYIAKLKGNCDGLMELRVRFGGVEYRPLCCYGPEKGQITLLIGATERDKKLHPPDVCQTALERRAQLSEKGRTCDHDLT